jgi:hypothetical protein
MSEVILREQTQRLLEDPLLGHQDIDATVRALVEAEYVRRLARYRQTDRDLNLKYQMAFEAFMAGRVVQHAGYTWEAETDAMNWEAAISGVQTLSAKLRELRRHHEKE